MPALAYSRLRGSLWGGGSDGRFLFRSDCKPAFSRDWWPPTAPRYEVDFNVEFTDEDVDHFGVPRTNPEAWLPSGPLELSGETGPDRVGGNRIQYTDAEVCEERVLGQGWLRRFMGSDARM